MFVFGQLGTVAVHQIRKKSRGNPPSPHLAENPPISYLVTPLLIVRVLTSKEYTYVIEARIILCSSIVPTFTCIKTDTVFFFSVPDLDSRIAVLLNSYEQRADRVNVVLNTLVDLFLSTNQEEERGTGSQVDIRCTNRYRCAILCRYWYCTLW